MADNLLTAQSVWENFITTDITEEVIDQRVEENIVIKRVYVSGRKVGEESVKIYGIVSHPLNAQNLPGLLVFQEIDNPISDALLIEMVKYSSPSVLPFKSGENT